MDVIIEELIQFLQTLTFDNSLLSIIISIVAVILTLIKTKTTTIQKKAGFVNLNQFKIEDYVLIYDNYLLTFKDVKIVKKSDLSKLDVKNLIDKGGVINEHHHDQHTCY